MVRANGSRVVARGKAIGATARGAGPHRRYAGGSTAVRRKEGSGQSAARRVTLRKEGRATQRLRATPHHIGNGPVLRVSGSGRHCGSCTTPGSKSSSPSKKRVTPAWLRGVAATAARSL
jgi:hypothetical protein